MQIITTVGICINWSIDISFTPTGQTVLRLSRRSRVLSNDFLWVLGGIIPPPPSPLEVCCQIRNFTCRSKVLMRFWFREDFIPFLSSNELLSWHGNRGTVLFCMYTAQQKTITTKFLSVKLTFEIHVGEKRSLLAVF